MPKYRNKSEFIRPLTIGGKRIAVKPNEVLFSERDLDLSIYNYLEKVETNEQPSNKVIELGPQKIKIVSPEEIKQVNKKLIDIENEIKHTPEDIENIKKDQETLKETLNLALKRLEVMKNAVEKVSNENNTLKEIVHDLEKEVYENGAIIIEGLEDTNKKE